MIWVIRGQFGPRLGMPKNHGNQPPETRPRWTWARLFASGQPRIPRPRAGTVLGPHRNRTWTASYPAPNARQFSPTIPNDHPWDPRSETPVLYTMPSRGPTWNDGLSLMLQDLGVPKPFKTDGFELETPPQGRCKGVCRGVAFGYGGGTSGGGLGLIGGCFESI